MIEGYFHPIAESIAPNIDALDCRDPLWDLTSSHRELRLLETGQSPNASLSAAEWCGQVADLKQDLALYDESIDFAVRARSLSEDPTLIAKMLLIECVSHLMSGRKNAAMPSISELSLLTEVSKDSYIEGLYALSQGYYTIHAYEGESGVHERAAMHFSWSAGCFEKAGEVGQQIRALSEYADSSAGATRYLGALRTCDEAAALCRQHRNWRYYGRVLLVASSAASDQGYRAKVEEVLRLSIHWSQFLGDILAQIQGYHALGRFLGYEAAATDFEAITESESALTAALDLAQNHNLPRHVQSIEMVLAWLFRKAGDERKRQEWLRACGVQNSEDSYIQALNRDSDSQIVESDRRLMAQLQGAIRRNPDAFFLYTPIRDEEQCVDFLNPYRNETADRLLGKNPGSFCTFSDVRNSDYLAGLDEALQNATEERRTFEDLITTTDPSGHPRCFTRHVFPGQDGAVLTIRDVTEIHQVQDALLDAAQKAQRSERVKSEFLANMSHEVRTPLNGILGLARLLSESSLDPVQAAYVQDIIGSGNTLMAVIGDVLDLSKLEACNIHIEKQPADLFEFVRDTVGLYRGQAVEKGITLSFSLDDSLPRSVLLDPARLRQILGNLIGNSVKFTANGSVELAVAADVDSVTFTVVDTGPGIQSDRLDMIFDRFHQEGASQGGTGLGLTISKRLGELMGGKMWVESAIGVGSRFVLRIPLEPCAPPIKTIAKPENARFDGVRILLVEDNRVNAIVSRRQLEKMGCLVEWVQDGAEALVTLESNSFDLVLMDVRMPVMNGLDATRELRRRETTCRVPVVALTAGALVDDRNECFEAGMDDHLSKPFTPDALITLLVKWIPVRGDTGERLKAA